MARIYILSILLLATLANVQGEAVHDQNDDTHDMDDGHNHADMEKPQMGVLSGSGTGNKNMTVMSSPFDAYPGKPCVPGPKFDLPISGHPVLARSDICRSDHTFLICKLEQCKCVERVNVMGYSYLIDMEFDSTLKRCVSKPGTLCTTSWSDIMAMECQLGRTCKPLADKPGQPFQVGVCSGGDDGGNGGSQLGIKLGVLVVAVGSALALL